MSKYLRGACFTIYTDHKSLIHMINAVKESKASSKVHRWIYNLLEYDFDLLYIPGEENVCADALSRAFGDGDDEEKEEEMPGREEASDKRDGEVSADKEKNGDEEKKTDEKQNGEKVEIVLVAGEKRQDEEREEELDLPEVTLRHRV